MKKLVAKMGRALSHKFKGSKLAAMKQYGFTLIELVIVIVIIGILVAAVIPKYVDLTDTAESATASADRAAVQSAFAIYLAENNGSFPPLTQLINQLQTAGATVAAGTTGIEFTINSQTYTVATYTDTGCSTATSGGSSTVRCVGAVS